MKAEVLYIGENPVVELTPETDHDRDALVTLERIMFRDAEGTEVYLDVGAERKGR